MKILSWNVNSIRIRKDQLLSVIKIEDPDIICLQETKTMDTHFPREILEKKGYFVEIMVFSCRLEPWDEWDHVQML